MRPDATTRRHHRRTELLPSSGRGVLVPYAASDRAADITSGRCAVDVPGRGGESPEWQRCQPAGRADRSPANHRLEVAPGRAAP